MQYILAQEILRGFTGELLFENHFSIILVDVNERIIDALNERGAYEIEIAEEGQRHIAVSNVRGINNAKNPEAVVEAVAKADLVTTAIDQISYHSLRNLSQKGIEQRRVSGNTTQLMF